MTPNKPASIDKAIEILERAYVEFESIPEAGESSLLNKVSTKMLEVFTLLHEKDPDLLSAEMCERVQERLAREKRRSGRDTFNTGF
jgi:hypothetical protein